MWNIRRLRFRTLFLASLSAPASISSRAQSAWPLPAAYINAVNPNCKLDSSQSAAPPPFHTESVSETKRNINWTTKTIEELYGEREIMHTKKEYRKKREMWKGGGWRNKMQIKMSKVEEETTRQRPSTHIAIDIFLDTGIDQKPHTVHVTVRSGPNQRRPSVLRVGFGAHTAPPSSHTQHVHNESNLERQNECMHKLCTKSIEHWG